MMILEDKTDDIVSGSALAARIPNCITISEPMDLDNVEIPNGANGIYIWYLNKTSKNNKEKQEKRDKTVSKLSNGEVYVSRLSAYVGIGVPLKARVMNSHLAPTFNHPNRNAHRPNSHQEDYKLGSYKLGSDLNTKMFSYLINKKPNLVGENFLNWIVNNGEEALTNLGSDLENMEGDQSHWKDNYRKAITNLNKFKRDNKGKGLIDFLKTPTSNASATSLFDALIPLFKKTEGNSEYDPTVILNNWKKKVFKLRIISFNKEGFDAIGGKDGLKIIESLLIKDLTYFDLNEKGAKKICFNKERDNSVSPESITDPVDPNRPNNRNIAPDFPVPIFRVSFPAESNISDKFVFRAKQDTEDKIKSWAISYVRNELINKPNADTSNNKYILMYKNANQINISPSGEVATSSDDGKTKVRRLSRGNVDESKLNKWAKWATQ